MNRIKSLFQSFSLVNVSKWLVPSLLGVALAWALLALLPGLITTHQLTTQHKRLKAEHATTAAQGEADHTTYRIDSARLATRSQQLYLQDSLLAQSERENSTTRRPRFVLPALEQLPRERSN